MREADEYASAVVAARAEQLRQEEETIAELRREEEELKEKSRIERERIKNV